MIFAATRITVPTRNTRGWGLVCVLPICCLRKPELHSDVRFVLFCQEQLKIEIRYLSPYGIWPFFLKARDQRVSMKQHGRNSIYAPLTYHTRQPETHRSIIRHLASSPKPPQNVIIDPNSWWKHVFLFWFAISQFTVGVKSCLWNIIRSYYKTESYSKDSI